MAESPSLAKRVSLLAVNLVNPRFTNFNKPLCLAISVGILSLACFVPVLGYYMSQETTVIADESSEGTNLVSGPSWEIDLAFRQYAKLPERCTLGSGSKFFQGNGKNTSEDGLTTVEYSCDYHACISSSYSLGSTNRSGANTLAFEVREHHWFNESFAYVDPDKILEQIMWKMCWVQDEYTEGLVKDSWYLELYRGSLRNISICRAGTSSHVSVVWCPLDEEAQAFSWIKQCCIDIERNSASALPIECQRGGETNATVFNNFCAAVSLELADYMLALNAQTRPSLYPICPDYQQHSLVSGSSRDDCPIGNNHPTDGGLDPISFNVHWSQKEIKTTRTRPTFLAALSSALALTTYIEMAVTVVVVVILRQCGCVKEVKKFTWGEIMNEQRDPEVEQKEMEERMQANIIVNLESNRDSFKAQRESVKGQENHLLGKATE